MFLGQNCGATLEARAKKNKKKTTLFVIPRARYFTQFGLAWDLFGRNRRFRTPHNSTEIGRKQTTIGCTQGEFCNTSDVVRAKLWREIGGPSKKQTRKISVFCDSTNKGPTQFGLFFEGRCDSEHPKTQQRDRKIGQTCEAKSEA